MREILVLLVAVMLFLALAPAVSAQDTLAISARPHAITKGETVTFSGTVTGMSTIAVYLFIIGPGLDTRGVTLENLNIPAGRGLFTTAPVNLTDGRWTYRWDTSVIIGTLEPGDYTVYVVSSPVDRMRFQKEDFATTDITILSGGTTTPGAPLDPVLPAVAVVVAGLAGVLVAGRQKPKR